MKQIPYKDTYLTFYHYKEPLKKAATGFGYQGAVLGSLDGTGIQCHLCGELWGDLAKHIIMSHKDDVQGTHGYKERFGLAFKTALVSETVRMNRKAHGLIAWQNMSAEKKREIRRKSKEAFDTWMATKKPRIQPKHQLETKNKRGTCPDQLLAKINECAKSIGHTPSKKDFIDWCDSQRFVHLIYKTFGSWTEGIKRAGLEAKKQIQNGGKREYSDDELLDSLLLFQQETGKIPSASDCRRGFLVDYNIYVRRFGSFPLARKLAGINERPTKWGVAPA